MLVSGHLRKKILISKGKKRADVVVVDYDENTHVARMIAANKPAGENDDLKLSALVSDLRVEGVDLSLAGMTLSDVDNLLDSDDDEKKDESRSPDDFDEYGDDIKTTHECPQCKYVW